MQAIYRRAKSSFWKISDSQKFSLVEVDFSFVLTLPGRYGEEINQIKALVSLYRAGEQNLGTHQVCVILYIYIYI